jgi:hypothetical protein
MRRIESWLVFVLYRREQRTQQTVERCLARAADCTFDERLNAVVATSKCQVNSNVKMSG